jgi:hypothetical protein
MSVREEPTDLELERYCLGELPSGRAHAIQARLASDPALRARVEALERSSAEILAAHPPALAAAHIRARVPDPAGARRSARVPSLGLATALAAAAALAMAVLLPTHARQVGDGVDTGADVVRVKGAQRPRILLFRQRTSEEGPPAEPLAPGARAREKDVVQVVYHPGGRRYGVIVSVDGRGTVTRHLPREGGVAAPLAEEGPVTLDAAYQLDDAPAFERFYFVTADKPFAVEPVLAAARRSFAAGTLRLDLPAAFAQAAFSLAKDTR